MPTNKKYLADFEESGTYHIYNKTNNKELFFLNDQNRLFFLKKYDEILSPFIDTYCWCLLPNHFHLLIKIKPYKNVLEAINKKEVQTITEKKFIQSQIDLGMLIEQTFKRFFQSYAQAFNKENNRAGNLFYKPFKRLSVTSDEHFTQTIIYIHANALKHRIVHDFTQYKWSSYLTMLSNKATNLLRNEVLDWFGSKDKFVKIHVDNAKYFYDYDEYMEV